MHKAIHLTLVTLKTASSAPQMERASNVINTKAVLDTPSTTSYHHQDAILFAVQSEDVFSVIAESVENA